MAGIRIAAVGLVMSFCLHISPCLAGEPAAQPPTAVTASPSTSAMSPSTESAARKIQPAISEDSRSERVQSNLQTDLRASEERLRQAIADNKPSWLEKLLPAILGLLGVFLGGAINVWVQGRQMASNENAHRATAAFEAQTKIIEYRSRQAYEFYHPLLLMLQRSSGVRRQLCDHLAKKDPGRFKFVQEPDGKHLFIYGSPGSNRVRFRLIESMYELATQHTETLPMVNEIVAIGEKMSALIHEKGGLVLSSQVELSSDADLTDLLGEYLAHFSILREVADKASKNPSQLQGIVYNVLYPTKLDTELTNGILFLQDKIKQWSEFSARLWDESMPDNPMPTLTLSKPQPNNV